MEGEFPSLVWQREYNKKWTTYSYEELCIINKAVVKKKKTVSIPSNDPEKKLIINFEKMIQKNLKSGFEQRVRCLIFNDSHYCWSWKDDYDDMVSYGPRIAFLLEVAWEKKLNKVDFTLKDDYEIDLKQLIQINKETQHKRSISRDKIVVKAASKENIENTKKIKENDQKCEDLVKKMASENIDNIQNISYDLPDSMPESIVDTASVSSLSSGRSEIISALSAELQASVSTQNGRRVLVDPVCPEANDYEVFSDDSGPYDATLNFTSVQDNNNKFFIIQLLKHNKKKKYAVWFHWGRLGYKGQTNFINCGANLDEAKVKFENKFYDKTRNNWSEKQNFERHPSKYDLVYTEHQYEEKKNLPQVESKLDSKIQDLLNIICNEKNWEEVAKEYEFDMNKTPLGKITPRQIIEGYIALNEVSSILKTKNKGKELIQACNKFYTKIPHDFKRKTPPLLSNMTEVKKKLKMLEDLSNIYLAMNVLNSNPDGLENMMDKFYRNLDCCLEPVTPDSEEFQIFVKCLKETHGPTHSAYTTELIDAFKCVKGDEESSFIDVGNKRLLWHGSRISNWVGILQKGLRIAPPEAPSTGFMFGKGIYFADVYSKSANYCHATKKNNEGCLILCEVSLGNQLKETEAGDFSKLPEDYNSVLGIGHIQPKDFKITALSPEASFPVGPLEDHSIETSLHYNEYIVYNVNQVRMKYLLRIKFHF